MANAALTVVTPKLLKKAKILATSTFGGSNLGKTLNIAEFAKKAIGFQTAKIEVEAGKKKVYTIKYTALETDCEIEASAACDDSCDVTGGTDLYSVEKDLTSSQCTKYGKSITVSGWKNEERAISDLQDAITACDEAICRKVNSQMVAAFAGNVGKNMNVENLGGAAVYDGATKLTTITGKEFDRTLVPYLLMTAEESRLPDYFLATETNFALDKVVVENGLDTNVVAKGGNVQTANGGDAGLYSNYVKAKGLNAAIAGPNGSLLIDKHSYAFISESKFNAKGVHEAPNGAGVMIQRFAIQSKIIPGLWIDFKYQVVCVNDHTFKHNFDAQSYWDVFFADDLCANDWTGTLGFVKA